MLVIHGDAGHDVYFLHPGHAFFPFPSPVLGDEGPDGRGEVEEFGVVGMENDFIDERDVFFEANIVGKPMLAAIGTLVNGIAHGAGIHSGREFRVDRQGGDAARGERRKLFPRSPAVSRFMHGVVRGHIHNVGVRRMERDRDHGRFTVAAGQKEQADQTYRQPEQGCHAGAQGHHSGRRPNHSVAVESR